MKNFYRILNIAVLLLWASAIMNILINWANIPDQVPTHYNFEGDPDNWGNKWFIFFPPTIGLALWLFMSALGNRKVWQLPGVKEHSAAHIENSTAMLRVMQAEILLIFSLLSLKDVFVVKGGSLNLGIWEMILVLTIIIGTSVFFTLRGRRIQKQEEQGNAS